MNPKVLFSIGTGYPNSAEAEPSGSVVKDDFFFGTGGFSPEERRQSLPIP